MTQPIVCVFCLCMSVTFACSRARSLVFVWVPIFRYHNDLILTNYELKSHFFFSSTILIPIFRGEFPTVLSVSFQFHLSLNTEGNFFSTLDHNFVLPIRFKTWNFQDFSVIYRIFVFFGVRNSTRFKNKTRFEKFYSVRAWNLSLFFNFSSEELKLKLSKAVTFLSFVLFWFWGRNDA